ncbi:MAG TPA: DUF2155 domain-containing protein [Reyranella sp.]|nr:DUF2155 domain-containing protein [Reyranella sp.]
MRPQAAFAVLVVAMGVTAFAGVAVGQTSPTQAASEQPPSSSFDNSPTLRAIPDGPGRPVAELQGLDKVTARTRRFIAPVGQSTTFGTLAITVGDCLVNTPDAPPEAAAYLTIVDHKPGQPEQKLFAGWMFASSPSISAMDDGVYDVRVLACTREQGSSPAKSP